MSPLTSAELETRLHRVTRLIPFLHALLGFVDGSDVHRSPGQLVPILRRYVRSILPGAELVVSSKPQLNYSIRDVAKALRTVFLGTSVQPSCDLLPERLFMVNIPSVESGQILIHGVLAHELGHTLYAKVSDGLLPKIKLNEDLVKNLVKAVYEDRQKQGDPTPELRVRKQVTEEITSRVHGWIKELCSDAIGIRLFGPALFFAEVHLLLSFGHMDEGSETHPPPRLRVKLMIRMLKLPYSVHKWRKELQSFLGDWDEASSDQIPSTDRYDQLALETLDDAALELISQASADATAGATPYAAERWARDTTELAPLFLSHIPPGEMAPYTGGTPVDMVSIINAGWHVYLCDFGSFSKSLHPNDGSTRFTAATKLHELVLKALEISGIRTTWEEARRDTKCGTN